MHKNRKIIAIVLIVLVCSVTYAYFSDDVELTGAWFKRSSSRARTSVQSALKCENVNPYQRIGSGVGDFLADGKTANEYCKSKGYKYCLTVINNFAETVFNSEDGSCSGGINYINNYNRLNSPANCDTRYDTRFVFGYNQLREREAQCGMGGTGGSDHYSLYNIEFLCCKT